MSLSDQFDVLDCCCVFRNASTPASNAGNNSSLNLTAIGAGKALADLRRIQVLFL
jgi:hypothetical protein